MHRHVTNANAASSPMFQSAAEPVACAHSMRDPTQAWVSYAELLKPLLATQAICCSRAIGSKLATAAAVWQAAGSRQSSLVTDYKLCGTDHSCHLDSLEAKPMRKTIPGIASEQNAGQVVAEATLQHLYTVEWFAAGTQHQHQRLPLERKLGPVAPIIGSCLKRTQQYVCSMTAILQAALDGEARAVEFVSTGAYQLPPSITRAAAALPQQAVASGGWAMLRTLAQESSISCVGADLDRLDAAPGVPSNLDNRLGVRVHWDEIDARTVSDGYGLTKLAGAIHVARLLPSPASGMAGETCVFSMLN